MNTMYRNYSGWYTPRTKGELLKYLLPGWKGRKTELREMSTQRLKAIFRTNRQRLIDGLMKKTKDDLKTEKPKVVIFDDGREMLFKDVCIMFKAKYVWMDGVKYVLPEGWDKK